jgi:exosortase C (VPDSG-CTERM-specific)
MPARSAREPEHGAAGPLGSAGFWVFLALLITGFLRSLLHLAVAALGSDLNSYILLVPAVSAYFFITERDRLAPAFTRSIGIAAVPFAFAVTALAFATIPGGRFHALSENDQLSLLMFSFVGLLWSGGYFFLGSSWMRQAAFPMFFLIFLVPLPDPAVAWIENGLRLGSAEAANMLFALTGTPAVRSNTVFQLPNITIEVAQECSGVRSTWVLLITAIIAAKMFLTKARSRLALIAAVIPLGIARNGFRILVIGLLCVHVDPNMINSIIHRQGGPLFFAMSLVPLLLGLWLLKRRETMGSARGAHST